jgi:hypothetical protein
MLHDFVLKFAISCEVARFATVIVVVILLLVAVAIFIAKLLFWFLLLDYIKMYQFRFLRLVMSICFRGIRLLCLSIISFA